MYPWIQIFDKLLVIKGLQMFYSKSKNIGELSQQLFDPNMR